MLSDPLNMIKASSKKDDKAIIGYGNWTSCMIKLSTDFLFVVLPMLLFLTVSVEVDHMFEYLVYVFFAIELTYSL